MALPTTFYSSYLMNMYPWTSSLEAQVAEAEAAVATYCEAAPLLSHVLVEDAAGLRVCPDPGKVQSGLVVLIESHSILTLECCFAFALGLHNEKAVARNNRLAMVSVEALEVSKTLVSVVDLDLYRHRNLRVHSVEC
jgi:hypothetical protein